MKKKFLTNFFKEIAYTAEEIGGLFTFDFYLHRGRKHNLFYPGEEMRYRKGFYNLKQRGYITSIGEQSFRFTKKGKEWHQRNVFRYTLFQDQKWDRKWRVVFFDIPEELHSKRDIFRNCLKNVGFYQLQKSMLTLPFKCEGDIADMANRLKIDQYVDVLVAESIGAKEDELKKIFNL